MSASRVELEMLAIRLYEHTMLAQGIAMAPSTKPPQFSGWGNITSEARASFRKEAELVLSEQT